MNDPKSPGGSGPVGAILAGGRSVRMGVPKEGIRLPDGRPMLEHVLSPLAAVCPQVVVVGPSRGYQVAESAHLRQLPDREPGLGPLGGLLSVLASGLAAGYLVAACDQPQVTAALWHRLLAGDPRRPHLFRGADEGDFHPFPGYYPADLEPVASELLRQGSRSLRALVARTEPLWLNLSPAEEARLVGINDPEQLRALARIYELK